MSTPVPSSVALPEKVCRWGTTDLAFLHGFAYLWAYPKIPSSTAYKLT